MKNKILQLGNYGTDALQTTNIELEFNNLPKSFNNTTIAFASDLHFKKSNKIATGLGNYINKFKPNLILFGGDYRAKGSPPLNAIKMFKSILEQLSPELGIWGVPGNHEIKEMIPLLEEAGMKFLINSNITLTKDNESIALIGIDDTKLKRDNTQRACENVNSPFSIMISHSPDALFKLNGFAPDLFLAGHTHGGQVCLPLLGPIATETKFAGRKFASGLKSHKTIKVFVSRGIGTTGIPIRFMCPPELVIIKLIKS